MTRNITPTHRYTSYIKLSSSNTKPYLMFSELIDNSISSFEKNLKNKWNQDNKLVVNIDIVMNNKLDDVLNMQVLSDSHIKVEDNGFGMSEEELISGMELDKKPVETKNSKMNVHGRGLKQCIFYFALDNTVHTNNGVESTKIEVFTSRQESQQATMVFSPQKIKREGRGTTVLMQNIHKSKKITQSSLENILGALSCRYHKYIMSGKIEINFKYKLKKGVETYTLQEISSMGLDDSNGSSNKIKYPKIELFNHVYKDKKDFDSAFEKAAKKIKTEEGKQSLQDFIKNAMMDTNKEMKRLFIESQKDENAPFRWNVKVPFNKDNFEKNYLESNADSLIFDENENIIIDFNFERFSSKAKAPTNFMGITIYEGDRAINHAPNTKSDNKNYKEWRSGVTSRSGSTENRFTGSVDLGGIVKPTTDKSKFDWSNEFKEDFDNVIFAIWEVYDWYIQGSKGVKDNNIATNPTDKDVKMIKDIIEKKFKDDVLINTDFSRDCIKGELINKNKKYVKIKINIDNGTPSEDLYRIDKRPNKVDNSIEITMFRRNQFWKQIDVDENTSKILGDLIYPFGVIIVKMLMDNLDVKGAVKTAFYGSESD